METDNRPSRRLKLLPWAAGWLIASVVLNFAAYNAVGGAFFAVLGDLCRWIGVVLLLGYVVARVLEELHRWRSGESAQPPGRNWYAG